MSTIITEVIGRIERIPWRKYLKKQLFKLVGIVIIAILIILVMIFSRKMGSLEKATVDDPYYIFAVLFSSLCFILVLAGFTKIVLFDMANEFGLRDDKMGKMIYDTRFFLFTVLSLSFCSSIYILLDCFLQNTYLELLPVLILDWILILMKADIHGLTDISDRREFYQTTRNLYFTFFFLIIVLFSVFVVLLILTAFGRKRITSFRKKEEKSDDEEQNRHLYKFLAWLAIPMAIIFFLSMLETPIGPIVFVILVIIVIWWIYQLLKVIFLILWRGLKITAFVTSVNVLLIIPLILVLYGLPVITWTFWDILQLINEGIISTDPMEIVQNAFQVFSNRATDIIGIIQLDFVFITMVATSVVGFAEGFAIIAIFTAIFHGVEVARTGQLVSESPPKVVVITKYLIMFGVWLSLFYDSFLEIWNMLIEQLNFALPEITIPSLFYLLYYRLIIPLTIWLEELIPNLNLEYIPLLIIPLYFIISGAFKFLSVTIVTPRVKQYLSIFFLLVSTAFVLIITNILGDLYLIQDSVNFEGIKDAPLRSIFLSEISTAVDVFQYIESIVFYAGFIFGIIWIIHKTIKQRKKKLIMEGIPEPIISSTLNSSEVSKEVE